MSITVAALTIHSIPLDFEGNKNAILEGIGEARERGAKLIVTPELCISGYGCLDHFLESDTTQHSWSVLCSIIQNEICKDVIIDLGLPVRHRNYRLNARVICTYRHIYFIRPKMLLANDGLYREMRYFSPWSHERTTETYYCEAEVTAVTGQKTVPIGDALLSTRDSCLGTESCEELFVPRNPSIGQGLNGAEIFSNSSASHFESRKLLTRLNLIANSTRKLGGIYIYANLTGVDGEARQMFDGSSMIILNGEVVAQGSQFSLKRSEAVVATVDLEKVRSYRSSISRNIQAASQDPYPRVESEIKLSRSADELYLSRDGISKPREITVLDPMAEIWKATACWLFQYLQVTNSPGFLLPLSGGADSCTSALMVYGMAKLVLQSIRDGDEHVLASLRRITGDQDLDPHDEQEITGKIFHTCYMGTVNSSTETRSRASRLAGRIGSYHTDTNIDAAVDGQLSIISHALGFAPKYTVQGGTNSENLSLQNIQARLRMVTAYSLAQLSTTARQTPRSGASLLVLGSANVDECLRGYLTKYDASSADINPLGSVSKVDVFAFIKWARQEWQLEILREFLDAVPSAELTPLGDEPQNDEEEMGFTYSELSTLGKLRKIEKLGPWSMYLRLLQEYKGAKYPGEVADVVTRFFRFHAMNRHKQTTITPALHMSAYSPEDNRFDLRPFLYVISFPWQFNKIQKHAEDLEAKMGRKTIKAD